MKKILIAGGSGLVGQLLIKTLQKEGYEVAILSRSSNVKLQNTRVIQWDLDKGKILGDISAYPIIINLAGAGIADKRWTPFRKKEILESRTNGTNLLASTIRESNMSPDLIINASAIGYYGESGDTLLSEDMGPQNIEFLSEVCVEWEKSAKSLQSLCKRLVILRIGTVLSRRGGALSEIEKPIKFGMANYIGSGNQWMSWIHEMDLCRMIIHCLDNKEVSGTYNAVSPNPVDNKNFTLTLRSIINKYAPVLPVPEFVVKVLFGELSRLVLNSNRVDASKMKTSGFHFLHPTLEEALINLYE